MLKRALWLTAISVFLTAMSSCVPTKLIDIVPGSEDCNTGCLAVAAGWPVAYIVDGHGLSPHGSADFVGMLLGIDKLIGTRALLNWLLWFFAIAATCTIFAKWRNRVW
jgi:hypothetical protein